VPFDLSDTSGIVSIVDQQLKGSGKIDYLINIGGISQRAELMRLPYGSTEKFRDKLFRTIALTKAVCHI